MKYFAFNSREAVFHSFDSLTELSRYLGITTRTIQRKLEDNVVFAHNFDVVSDSVVEHRSSRGNPNFGK